MGGDPQAVFVTDQVCRDLQAAMGQAAARGDFCHLLLNGHYWGLYNTCERPEASYGATYFGGRQRDYDVVKQGSREPGLSMMATDGNLDAWKRLYDEASAGLRDNTAYFALQGRNPDGTVAPGREVLLDADNLIDYMLVNFYTGNLDGPASWFGDNRWSNNWYGLRSRRGKDGFRFFIWDAEHTFLLKGMNDGLFEDRPGPFLTGDTYGSSNPQGLWQQCGESRIPDASSRPDLRLLSPRWVADFGIGPEALSNPGQRDRVSRNLRIGALG